MSYTREPAIDVDHRNERIATTSSALFSICWVAGGAAVLSALNLVSVGDVGTKVCVGHSAWQHESNAFGGTSRVASKLANYYQPRTDLGRRLLALRQAAIAKGMSLVPTAQIVSELDENHG